MQTQKHQLHQPVLLESVLEYMNPKAGETYLDLTAGYGGHARAILAKTKTKAVLVDRDSSVEEHLAGLGEFLHMDFASAAKQLVEQGKTFDLILMDLGVSSPQLDIANRGFSFQRPGPLDMRMDQSQELTAKELINNSSEKELEEILSKYGEEPKARKIAKALVEQKPPTTEELANLVGNIYRRRRGRTHPATRTFQAIRIAVNKELEQIEETLPLLPKLLNEGGRLGVISFHSLEDRLVKRFLLENARSGYEAEIRLITRKPVSKVENNPRSRSAKLRVAEKIKTKKGA